MDISASDISTWTFRPLKMPKVDVSAIAINCGLGVCMHKCVMHFSGNNCLNNLIYYISPKLYWLFNCMYLQAEMKTVCVLIR